MDNLGSEEEIMIQTLPETIIEVYETGSEITHEPTYRRGSN